MLTIKVGKQFTVSNCNDILEKVVLKGGWEKLSVKEMRDKSYLEKNTIKKDMFFYVPQIHWQNDIFKINPSTRELCLKGDKDIFYVERNYLMHVCIL